MTEHQADRGGHSGDIACGREPLITAITRFLEHDHAGHMPEIRATLERAIDEAGPAAVQRLSSRLADGGTDWTYYPGDPLARCIHHALAGTVLQQEPVIVDAHRLPPLTDAPLVLVSNHLSYSDANVIEVLLAKAGHADISDRLTVIAGPKVFSNVRRRFSSLCFGTIRVPQSSSVSSEDAIMSTRDVARGARRSIQIAQDRLRLGEVLLLFAEGSRSRSGGMQQFLAGAARYLERPGTWILPLALSGTERLFPIGEDGLRPLQLRLSVGQPVPASLLANRASGDRQLMMNSLGLAIADLLPAEYRGVYDHTLFRDTEPLRIWEAIRGTR